VAEPDDLGGASAAPDKKASEDPPAEKVSKNGASDKRASKGEVVAADGPSVAAHPRAARAVARSKAWAGLIGFGAGAYFSMPTGTVAETLARALAAGVVGYVAVWAAAVFLWRRLVILELKGREQQLVAAARARRGARELPAPERPSAARSAS